MTDANQGDAQPGPWPSRPDQSAGLPPAPGAVPHVPVGPPTGPSAPPPTPPPAGSGWAPPPPGAGWSPPPTGAGWGPPPPGTQWGSPYPQSPYGYGYGQPPPTLDKGARTSLIVGIVGLLICGLFLGPAAIVEGVKARKRIAESNGTLTGEGLAIAGIIIGVVATAGSVLAFVYFFSRSGTTTTRLR